MPRSAVRLPKEKIGEAVHRGNVVWLTALIGGGGDFQADETIMVGSRQRIQRRIAVRRDNLGHIGFVGWTDSCAGRRKISQGGTFNINPLIVRKIGRASCRERVQIS